MNLRIVWIAAASLVAAAACTIASDEADGTARSSTTSLEVLGTSTVRDATTTSAPLGGINASLIEAKWGQGVMMVLTRACDGRPVSRGTGFAIDARTIVTNRQVVAENSADPNSPVDPHPWILTYDRMWQRGTVIGVAASPDVAVIRLDDGEPDITVPLAWSATGPTNGQHLAVLGYPELDGGAFNIAVGTAQDVDGATEGIPSFAIQRTLAARAGPGNSGGPIVNAAGQVVGIQTWGKFDRSRWVGEDEAAVRPAIESIMASPPPVPTACPPEAPQRVPLVYTARLGTFETVDAANARATILNPATEPGSSIINVTADAWSPFLLSDNPVVLLAGPFLTKADAERAVGRYQAALDASGQVDLLSAGVMPFATFAPPTPTTTVAPTPAPVAGSCITVATFGLVIDLPAGKVLTIRAAPSANAPIIATIKGGEGLGVGTADLVEADGATWINIQTSSNGLPVCGWTDEQFVLPYEDSAGG